MTWPTPPGAPLWQPERLSRAESRVRNVSWNLT